MRGAEIVDEVILRRSIRPMQKAFETLYRQLDEALAMIDWLQEKPHNYWGA